MRVPGERRQRLAGEGRIDVDRQDVAALGGALDRPQLGVAFPHRGYGPIHSVLPRRLGSDRGTVREVVPERDLGSDDDRRGVAKRFAFLELSDLRVGPVDRLESFRVHDLAVGLVHQVVGRVLPEMILSVGALVHRARRLARPEAGDLGVLHVLRERGIRGARQPVRFDLDVERHARSGLTAESVLDG